VLRESWARKALGQRVSHILSAETFEQLDLAEVDAFAEKMKLDVHMARALSIDGIFAHKDTRGVILPYSSRPMLRAIKAGQ
jgi:hypothetical protein